MAGKTSKSKNSPARQRQNNNNFKKNIQKKERTPENNLFYTYLTAIGLIILSLFIFVSLLFNVTGVVGRGIKAGGFGLFGLSAMFLPLFFIYTAANLTSKTRSRKILGGVLSIITVSGILSLFSRVDGTGFKIFYESGKKLKSGGIIGGYLHLPLSALIGSVGTGIVLFGLLFINFILITGISPIKIARYVINLFEIPKNYIKSHKRDVKVKPKPKPVIQEKPRKMYINPQKTSVKDIPEEIPSQEDQEDNEYEDEDIVFTITQPPAKKSPAATLDIVRDESEDDGEDDEDPMDALAALAADTEEDSEPITIFYGITDHGTKTATPKVPEKKEKKEKMKPEEIAQEELSINERIKEELTESDGLYAHPPITLLNQDTSSESVDLTEEYQQNARTLVKALQSYGIGTTVSNVSRGPSVTRYELLPKEGVKVSAIKNRSDDIALHLAAKGIRIEAPIPGKMAIGIEVPNKTSTTVYLRELIDSYDYYSHKGNLAVTLGKDISNQNIITDLARMPHMLIAGTTGSGKSVCINTILISLIYKYSPDHVKFIMIDPKVVELNVYNGIPHLLTPVVTDPRKAAGALNWAVTEMEGRFRKFADSKVRDITGYNKLCAEQPEKELEPLNYIVIIIDELADLMIIAKKDVEDAIFRLAAKARAAGMHLVVATQRPTVDVLSGTIKANISARIAFAVNSRIDSQTILDEIGAEKLLGRGDMLYKPIGENKPLRVQGCYISDPEVESVVEFVKNNITVETEYSDEIAEQIENSAPVLKEKDSGSLGDEDDSEDPMIAAAIECIINGGKASTTFLQNRLKLGYARAARIMDILEERGIVGPHAGSKPREVLITRQEWQEMNMRS